ncbi:hypothetical protein FV139_12615 [Parahaliea maris]|uniref:Uncharacterized protein n=1 Tax=Parahaliea maris TaxID=2716870 RepID=A0A5C8ZZI8_9GAMM|nr:hypothetical protein [Parahaliea maris]TXS92807.1 hypothetical protein FV139_12615 [Parahaliea maris]
MAFLRESCTVSRSGRRQFRLVFTLLTCLGSLMPVEPARANGLVDRVVEDFQQSEFVFQRSGSLVPFPPVATIGGSQYGSAEVSRSDRGEAIEYDLSTISQAAGIPWLVTERDAVIVGEYLSWSKFDLKNGPRDSFNVATVGLPVGWLRQVNPRWQTAAFVMPMGHKASLPDADWSWQVLGGAFARYVQTDRLWWAFGVYADIAPGEDFFVPYLGASLSLNNHWTLSAVMPWPAILYAPDDNWLFRFGVTPSGASWSAAPSGTSDDVAMNLDAWDLGLTAERRLLKNVYLGLEAGVGGFRGFRVNDNSSFEDIEVDAGSSPFVRLQLKLRPGLFD